MPKSIHSHRGLLVLNVISLIFMLTINALANALPINSITTGEVSAAYENLFTPAGFTFSIWGVIYLLLLVQLIAMIIMSRKYKPSILVFKLGKTLPLVHLTNSAWLITWHYEQIAVSWALIVLLLYLLIISYLKTIELGGSTYEYLFGKLPVKIYLGWVMVASIANTAVLITKWQPANPIILPIIWAPLFALILVIATSLFLYYWKDIALTFTVIWALSGIYLGNITRQAEGAEIMRWVALIGIMLLFLSSIYTLIQRLTKVIPPLKSY